MLLSIPFYLILFYRIIFFTSSMMSLLTGNFSFRGGPFLIPVQTRDSNTYIHYLYFDSNFGIATLISNS